MYEYTANGNMYGGTHVFSSFYSNMHTEPFKTSVNELYNYMLRRCLNRFKEYEDPNVSIEFVVLRHMQQQAINPLSVVLDNDAYYFSDAKELRRIDKYESN
jgi:hypothetical protein